VNQISSTPILLTIELGFVFMLARRSGRLFPTQGSTAPVYLYLLWVTAYAIVTSILGARGVYISDDLLETLPALWLQLVTVGVIVLPIVASSAVRNAMRRIVDHTPWHWFAYFHALRIGAVGTAYKTAIVEFPAYFEYSVGIPDFLFGVSAIWVARKAIRGEIAEKSFMLWNLIGVLVIVPSAPILLQLGLPGPLQVFTSLPDARAVFTYPMSIAPMIGVPLFASINLWVAWRIWERRSTTQRNDESGRPGRGDSSTAN
jgi:hypothetical protein